MLSYGDLSASGLPDVPQSSFNACRGAFTHVSGTSFSSSIIARLRAKRGGSLPSRTQSFAPLPIVGVLFGAICKVLPDRSLQWKDVIVGAAITSIFFNIGKSLIAWYIGSSAIASSYGAAGGLIVLLLWVYYSVQIFLFGAEFTKIYANRHGSKRGMPVA